MGRPRNEIKDYQYLELRITPVLKCRKLNYKASAAAQHNNISYFGLSGRLLRTRFFKKPFQQEEYLSQSISFV